MQYFPNKTKGNPLRCKMQEENAFCWFTAFAYLSGLSFLKFPSLNINQLCYLQRYGKLLKIKLSLYFCSFFPPMADYSSSNLSFGSGDEAENQSL